MMVWRKDYGMTAWIDGRRAAFGAFLALSTPICIQPAAAAWSGTEWGRIISVGPNARVIQANAALSYPSFGRSYSVARYGRFGAPLQCVPFARENSGIELTGNAANWWGNAAGVYERGNRPEVGSVLSFRATGRMRLGHVAVVSRIVDSRSVEIDHANWAYPGAISRHVDVVDVSPNNDWTAVRVALARGNDFGSVYPSYGFIYRRADRGTVAANAGAAAAPVLNLPAVADGLRRTGEPTVASPAGEAEQEVAEAADDATQRARRSHPARVGLRNSVQGATMRRVANRFQPAARATQGRRFHHNS